MTHQRGTLCSEDVMKPIAAVAAVALLVAGCAESYAPCTPPTEGLVYRAELTLVDMRGHRCPETIDVTEEWGALWSPPSIKGEGSACDVTATAHVRDSSHVITGYRADIEIVVERTWPDGAYGHARIVFDGCDGDYSYSVTLDDDADSEHWYH